MLSHQICLRPNSDPRSPQGNISDPISDRDCLKPRGSTFLASRICFFSYVFCYSGIKFSFKYFLRLFFYFNLAQVKGLSSSFSTIQNSFLISLLLLLLQNSSIFLSISSDLSLLFSEIYWKAQLSDFKSNHIASSSSTLLSKFCRQLNTLRLLHLFLFQKPSHFFLKCQSCIQCEFFNKEIGAHLLLTSCIEVIKECSRRDSNNNMTRPTFLLLIFSHHTVATKHQVKY